MLAINNSELFNNYLRNKKESRKAKLLTIRLAIGVKGAEDDIVTPSKLS